MIKFSLKNVNGMVGIMSIIGRYRKMEEIVKHIQDVLLQPEHDAILIRYMDKWKYDTITENGLVFSQVSRQSDICDGMMPFDDSGYARFNNNLNENAFRNSNYISCWTLDNVPSLQKFNEYCKNINEPRYAIKTTYKKLVNFCKSKCLIQNDNYIFSRTFSLLYGKVEYINYEETSNAVIKPWDNGLAGKVFFYKNEKFIFENEFRLLLFLVSAKAIPCDKNFIIDSEKEPLKIQFMFGEKPDFIDSVYECSPDGEIFKI